MEESVVLHGLRGEGFGNSTIMKFTKVFLGQLCMMALVTWNFRMIAAGNVPMVGMSEAIWAFINFWYLKFIVRDDSTSTYLGYALGCVVGTTGTVIITKHIF